MYYGNINVLLFNRKFELVNNYELKDPKNKYGRLFGYKLDSTNYHFFFTNKKEKVIFIKTINTQKQQIIGKKLDFKFKKERLLGSFKYKAEFYFFSVLNKSSLLNLYKIKNNKIFKVKEFDFSAYKFSDGDYYTKLYNILSDSYSSTRMLMVIHKINNEVYNTLNIASKLNKFYRYNDKIYFTFDNSLRNTKIITIDMENLYSNMAFYDQATDCNGDTNIVSSNSFLFQEKLFQVALYNNGLCLQVRNIEKDSILEKINFNINDVFLDRSTTFIIKKPKLLLKQVIMQIESTKQFWKELSKTDLGIAVNLNNGMFELTLGGVKESMHYTGGGGITKYQAVGTAQNFGAGHNIAIPGSSLYSHHCNPIMYNYNKTDDNVTVFCRMLLDENYEYYKGEVSKNIYDRIRDFKKVNHRNMQTVSKIGAFYIFGYCNYWKEKYYLYRFRTD